MKITVHRGINQIGGCITEIATDTTRILIDLGKNLPDNSGNNDDYLDSKSEVAQLCNGIDAIFYTHYHGDHVGHFPNVPDSIPQYIGKVSKQVMAIKAEVLQQDIKKVERLKTFQPLDKIAIGNIVVTPYFVSHSAADSYMFLIEAEGKRILHTGDLRGHGYLSKGLVPTLKKYIKQIDFLIIEGTMLSRSNEKVESERELKVRVEKLMAQYKYVFVLASSTDMDRLATFHKANPTGRLFVCDRYQKRVLDLFTANGGSYSDLYKFENLSVFPNNTLLEDMIREGFCMMVRVNKYDGKYSRFTSLTINKIPNSERVLIYSMWGGYLDSERHQNKEYIEFCKRFDNIERIHTSGHASLECLTEVCELTNPRVGIIPIHSERSDNFHLLPITEGLKRRIITTSANVGGIDVEIIDDMTY